MRKEVTSVTTSKKKSKTEAKVTKAEEPQNKHKTMNRMTIVSPSLSVINLNVSGLNSLLKTYNKAT